MKMNSSIDSTNVLVAALKPLYWALWPRCLLATVCDSIKTTIISEFLTQNVFSYLFYAGFSMRTGMVGTVGKICFPTTKSPVRSSALPRFEYLC